MTSIVWARPEWLHLAWPALALALLLVWLELDRNARLRRWMTARMAARLATGLGPAARIVRLVAIVLALGFAVAALMRPQTRERTTVRSQVGSADIVVAMDVSRSMLATDGGIARLDRAKAEVRDLLPLLQGNRVSLVAFAGRAVEMVPLTADHGFFQMILDGTDPGSIGRGGTELAGALRTSIEVLEEDPEAGRAIILMTDGEDHGSGPLRVAEEAKRRNIPIIAIGFGDEAGSTIMIRDPETGRVAPLMYDGEAVVSKLDGETLRAIALETDGVYVPAKTGALDLESIVDSHISPLLARRSREVEHKAREELYPWFLATSILFLCISSLVGVVGLVPAGAARGDAAGEAQ